MCWSRSGASWTLSHGFGVFVLHTEDSKNALLADVLGQVMGIFCCGRHRGVSSYRTSYWREYGPLIFYPCFSSCENAARSASSAHPCAFGSWLLIAQCKAAHVGTPLVHGCPLFHNLKLFFFLMTFVGTVHTFSAKETRCLCFVCRTEQPVSAHSEQSFQEML